MEDYYNTLLQHLDGYTVMGLFDGKRDIKDIVTLQTGHKGRVFFFDQEPMIKGVDDALWDYIFQEPTVFANSELDSEDKEYVKANYPNFIDWYYFSNALLSREWFSAQRYNYAGWTDQKQTVLDCNLITGPRQYRIYLIYKFYEKSFDKHSYLSFNGTNWKESLLDHDYFNILGFPDTKLKKIPNKKISYDNWGQDNYYHNGLMQSCIPLNFYSQVNYVTIAETVYIENKKHLTEKIFKPIAAGKPFVLVGGYKNLEYLKTYGFETFDYLWNENYDNIVDPKERLDCLFYLIARDLNLGSQHLKDFVADKNSIEFTLEEQKIPAKLQMFEAAHTIAQRNREYFWSDEFYNQLLNEACQNLEVAKKQLAAAQVQCTAMMPTT
jgi:hypothetical protein